MAICEEKLRNILAEAREFVSYKKDVHSQFVLLSVPLWQIGPLSRAK